MPEDERAQVQFFHHYASEPRRRLRVVIARNPDPVERARKAGEARRIIRIHPRFRIAVMEAVAERDDGLWLELFQECFQPGDGRPCVIGRQRDAARGKGRSLLQMKIGNDKQPFVRQPCRTFGQEVERHAADGESGTRCRDYVSFHLDVARVAEMLKRVRGRICLKRLDRVSPLAVPVLLDIGKVSVGGEADDALLSEAADDLIAEATRLV